MNTGWQTLSTRERALLLGAGALLVPLLFYAFVWRPLDQALGRAEAGVQRRQTDLVWMQQAAAQLASLPPARESTASAGTEPLAALIDRSASLAGLDGQLRQLEPLDNGRYALRFEQVPFATFSDWLRTLVREQGVTIEEAGIERTGAPGMVNARLVMH